MCFQIALCLKAVWAKFNLHLPLIFPLLPSQWILMLSVVYFCAMRACREGLRPCVSACRMSSTKVSHGHMIKKLTSVNIPLILYFLNPPWYTGTRVKCAVYQDTPLGHIFPFSDLGPFTSRSCRPCVFNTWFIVCCNESTAQPPLCNGFLWGEHHQTHRSTTTCPMCICIGADI